MAEAIPLGATLSVERVAVVVGNILGDCLVAMLKGFAAERGLLGDIERETGKQLITNQLWMCRHVCFCFPDLLQSHHLSSQYLLRRRLDPLRCQKVQSSQLVQFRQQIH